MRRLPSLLLISLLGALPAAGIGAPGPSAEVGQVQGWLDSWETLSGRFEQALASPTLPSAQIESGLFQVSRPDRMRWDYRRPEKKLAVTDGVDTWLYVPADRQVIRGSMETLRRDSAVSLLLSGGLRIEEAFHVREAVRDGENIVLILQPKEESDSVDQVELQARQADGAITGFTISDGTGNQVTWSFSHLKLNPALKPALFAFTIPGGVEVQDLEAGTAESR